MIIIAYEMQRGCLCETASDYFTIEATYYQLSVRFTSRIS
jgi:hypothetical protein